VAGGGRALAGVLAGEALVSMSIPMLAALDDHLAGCPAVRRRWYWPRDRQTIACTCGWDEAELSSLTTIDSTRGALGAAWNPVQHEDSGSTPDDVPRIRAGAQALDVRRSLVTTAAELERVKPEILGAPVLGVDIEGTGLDPLTARVRLVQLASRERVYVLDTFRLGLRSLQPVFDGARWLMGHNLKFDVRMLMAGGISLPTTFGCRSGDTMLAGRLLGPGSSGERYRLADLAHRYLGIELDKSEQVSDWSDELTDDQIAYAARDAAVLLPLKDRLHAEIDRAGLVETTLVEYGALPAIAWLEQTGAPLDGERWLRLAEAAEERRRACERELDEMEPPQQQTLALEGLEEIPSSRWGSPAQVLKLLEQRGVILPDTGFSTLREHQDADPLIPLLLRHREAAKLCGSFGREFLRFVHPATDRVHAEYFQTGSAAGRMACGRPNLQQVPRAAAYRACFRAPEGRVLVKSDFSQIELRIAAEIAGDRRLIDAYEQDLDVHELTARQVLGRSQVTRADRQAAKAIAFGLLYGMGAPGLRRYAKTVYGVEMSGEEAGAYRERFFETYAGLREWHRRQPDGVVETRTLAGRRRLGVERFTEKLNTPVQGTGADGLKLALGRLYETRDEVPSAAPVLVVHDEIVLECDRQDAQRAATWLERCMREGMAELLKCVPVEVETQIGRDWSMADEAPSLTAPTGRRDRPAVSGAAGRSLAS
jgi:DNA polymerase I-like protein with 3'-5' exonuclease and polymerase domains